MKLSFKSKFYNLGCGCARSLSIWCGPILSRAAGDQGRAEWRTFATAGHRSRCNLLWSTQLWHFNSQKRTKLPQHSGPCETWFKIKYSTKASSCWQESEKMLLSIKAPVRRRSLNWYLMRKHSLYSCGKENMIMDFVSMQTTCFTQSPSNMSHHV